MNNKIIVESISQIQNLPFIGDIKNNGGSVFSVGGAVRDSFLNKESKDLDILITNIKTDVLMNILNKYGRVDLVGMSFGVIKFKATGTTEEIDIAIPRTETKVGDGHQGFEVKADPFLPIEKDLERRDFTINAIAKDIDGNIIDPFNGRQDIQNRIIRVVNPKAFSEDPLRMLRSIQFAARFNFTIEPNTLLLIQQNAHDIKTISPERIIIELQKIVDKGNPEIGAKLLIDTGLYTHIFNSNINVNLSNFRNVKTLGEFIYLLKPEIGISDFFKNNLKGDIDSVKEIKALELMLGSNNTPIEKRTNCFKAINISPKVLNTLIVPEYTVTLQEFKVGKYPKSYKELAVNGNDLMSLGFQGIELGKKLNQILLLILKDELKNEKEVIINFIKISDKINKILVENILKESRNK